MCVDTHLIGDRPMNQSGFGPYSASLTASTAALGPGTHRVEASLVFADVSGYTALTERLATLGRVGAEMLTDTVNTCFTRLIDAARHHGGDVLRFGGDALFLAFVGRGRLDRALQAASEMQQAMAALPAIAVPGRRVRLRQSIGVHDGELLLHVWHGSWTEVVPFGPGVTETLRCEAAARSGEIAISEAVARMVPVQRVRRRDDGQALWRRASVDVPAPAAMPAVGRGVSSLIAPQVRAAVTAGVVPEHRAGAIGFVALKGLDRSAANDPLDAVLAAADRAGNDLGVAVLGTDVAPDGIKLIVAAGVPTSEGDDAERLAVALDAIVRSVGEVGADARAGADQGVVFCGDVGHPERRTFTVMGDTVNLAARLAARAERGTVLASAAMVDALPASMSVAFVEPFAVRGKRGLQRAAEVTTRDSVTDDETSTALPFRGRAGELRRVRTALDSQSVVELVGPAGLGSTRLLAAALDGGPAGGAAPARVTARVSDRSAPLRTVRRLIEILGGPQAWHEVHHAVFQTSTHDGASPALDRGLAALAEVAHAVERHWADGRLVVVESTHHLDEASRRVLDVLIIGLHSKPRDRVLALTGRSPFASSSVIELTPLDPVAIHQIADDASTSPLTDATLSGIVAVAAGSPLLAVQLARLGRDAQLPPSAEALVTSRLDRLPADVRRVVRELAVVGSTTTLDSAAAITGRDRREILSTVRRAPEVLRPLGDELEFIEESTRVVAAAGMATKRRRELHARTAQHLELDDRPPPGLVADHWFAAGDHAGVLRWAPLAADATSGAGASDEACEHLRRALLAATAIGRPADERFALAERMATSAAHAARHDLESWALAVAAGCAGSTAMMAQTLVRRAGAEREQGHARAAAAHLARARRHAEPLDAVIQGEIVVEQAWQAVWAGRWDRALEVAARATLVAESAGEPRLRFAAWSLLEQIRSAKALPGANEAAAEAVRAGLASGDERLVGMAEVNAAVIADNAGRWQEAVSLYERSEEAFLRCGDPLNVAKIRLNRSTILVEIGAVDEATSLSTDAARATAAAGDTTAAAAALCVALRSRMRAGQFAATIDPIRRVEEAVAHLVTSGEDELAAFCEVGLVEMMLLQGHARDARRRATALLPTVDRYGHEHLLPTTVRRLIAVAGWMLDDRVDARTWLAAAEHLATRHRITPEIAAITALAAQWASLDCADDADALALRSAELDAALGVQSRPWFVPRPGRHVGVSGA